MSIQDSYFLDQSRRLREAERWFNSLKDIVKADIDRKDQLLLRYSEYEPRLKEQYATKFEGTTESFTCTNGNAAIEVTVNKPVGWIKTVITRNSGFEQKIERGAASVIYIGPGDRPMDGDKFKLAGIGILKKCINVAHIATLLVDALYESELADTDCVTQN